MERTPTSLHLLTGNPHPIFSIASALEDALRHQFHRSETSRQQYQKRLLFTDDFVPLRMNGKSYQAKLLRALEDGSIDLNIRDEQGKCSQINTSHHQQLCWDFPPLKP